MITSTANPRVKDLARLRDRSAREATGTFSIEGSRAVERALDAGWPCVDGYVAPELATLDAVAAATKMGAAGIPVTELGADAFRKVCYRRHPDGILAVGRTATTPIGDLDLPADPLLLVVEAVEKPGNLGAMLRTADGAGVDAVIVVDQVTDLFNPNVVRASQGALFTVPVAVGPAAQIAAWLDELGTRVVAMAPHGRAAPWEIDLAGPAAVVIGSEHAGLSDVWTDLDMVRLPMKGSVDSLNAATTAAVVLYEARRQRG